MYEDPESLNEESKRRTEFHLDFAEKMDRRGHLLDGFAMCADYCFNVNPFFNPEQFEELIVPYLKEAIDGYRQMGDTFYCWMKAVLAEQDKPAAKSVDSPVKSVKK